MFAWLTAVTRRLEAKIVGVTESVEGHNRLLARSDLVVEAVPEDMQLKHKVLSRQAIAHVPAMDAVHPNPRLESQMPLTA